MPLATLRQVLDEAAKGGYGVRAFNVNNMEQLKAIFTRGPGGVARVPAGLAGACRRGATFPRHLFQAAIEIDPADPDRASTRTTATPGLLRRSTRLYSR